ncbi:MAG: hypothetical protein CMI00_13390 [Oceanospirillaceae bacterium]|nr:hypothetical protein [Oceanospirillaceae bacterium]|tara:strand:- start:7990 stop:10824 length:2835 start_codon:yes stop_codon:yes gene_type:complete
MLSPRYWTFLVIVLAAIIYSVIRMSHATQPVSSPADPYSYRYLQLENGLRVLLVQTPGADKASAAMSVGVGAMDDPEGREGLAHFLEHMLFLGTEPYPDADAYQHFISQNGGSHNAFTSYRQTTYFFDVDNDQLTPALDRFAPFFISPTFDAAYVEREMNAVNAEYKASLKDDGRRIFAAGKLAMNPDFSFARFSTGNLDTLANRPDSNTRDELIEFYQTHYSADRMTLVITGDYPLATLEQLATAEFSAVPHRDVHFSRADVPVYRTESLPLDMHIEPVKELRQIRFTFPLPEVESHYANKPLGLLSHLLGHEGEGSILALLKSKGWAENLNAGVSLSTENASALTVTIGLTRAGAENTDAITRVLLSYIDLLNSGPLPDYLKHELQLLNDMSFRYQEHGDIARYATSLSGNMQNFPPADIIYGSFRADPPSDDLLQTYISKLTRDNMVRTLIAPDISTDSTDPWYGTAVAIAPLDYDPDIAVEGLEALHLPEPNPFIPEDFSMDPAPASDTPDILVNSPERQVWYYPEHDFALPKSQFLARLMLPQARDDARQQLLARLYVRAVNENLNTYSYPAQLAGLGYSLSVNEQGLEIRVAGFQDKLPELLRRVLNTMHSFEVSDDAFVRYRESLRRELQNAAKARPYQRVMAEMNRWLTYPSFSEDELQAQLDTLSAADVRQFARDFPRDLASLSYVHGSVSAVQATLLADILNDTYPASTAFSALPRTVQLPDGRYQQDITQDHPDMAMALYVQGKETSDDARAVMGLLGHMISTPYYNVIRTEKQLGYIVYAAAFPRDAVPGLIFVVQSPEATPEQMIEQSELFFRDYVGTLTDMKEEEFALFREGLVTRLTEKPKNMAEKALRNWSELLSGRTTFDSREQIASRVAGLTLDEVRALYQDAMINGQYSWLLFSKGGELDSFSNLSDLERAGLPRFPAVSPGATD